VASRGVLYVQRDGMPSPLLARSLDALRRVHPELPHHVAIVPDGAPGVGKARALVESPFETTLFLDPEAVVLGRLDFALERAERYRLACCLSDNPWQRSFLGVGSDAVLYDTGMLIVGAAAREMMESWSRLAGLLDAPLGRVENGQTVQAPDDRLGFARALELHGFAPFVLPCNWGFRPAWHRTFNGPIKLWLDPADVPETVLTANRGYAAPDAILEFHALDR
jgi:hypothetical protein